MIPILMFNDTLGKTLLPLSIEAQDFQSALAATTHPQDRQLVESHYHLDQQAQPPCYRLNSSSVTVVPIDHTCHQTDSFITTFRTIQDASIQQRLLDIFISVFTPELSDAYLTTLFEQV